MILRLSRPMLLAIFFSSDIVLHAVFGGAFLKSLVIVVSSNFLYAGASDW